MVWYSIVYSFGVNNPMLSLLGNHIIINKLIYIYIYTHVYILYMEIYDIPEVARIYGVFNDLFISVRILNFHIFNQASKNSRLWSWRRNSLRAVPSLRLRFFFWGLSTRTIQNLTVIENIDKKYLAFHFGWVYQLGFLHKNGMLRSINIEIITCGNVHQTWWWLQISHLTSAWITRPHIVLRHWNDCVNLLGRIGESSAKFAVW